MQSNELHADGRAGGAVFMCPTIAGTAGGGGPARGGRGDGGRDAGVILRLPVFSVLLDLWLAFGWALEVIRQDLLAFQYVKGACKKDGDRLCSRACSDRTRGSGFKLKEGRFRLDGRNSLP